MAVMYGGEFFFWIVLIGTILVVLGLQYLADEEADNDDEK